MARELRVNHREQVRWIRAIALSLQLDPETLTITDCQDICRANRNIATFEEYLRLK